MGIILVKGDNVFKIDNELKSANIPRTVRFTEPLFEKLNKTAAENGNSFNLLVSLLGIVIHLLLKLSL